MRNRIVLFKARHKRVRKKISGTADRPRMAIKVTNRYIYVQFIDDERGHTMASVSSMKMDGTNSMATARLLGVRAAGAAAEVGIQKVVVDRSGHRYHGRVKAIVEAVAEAGLLPGVNPAEQSEGRKEEKK